MKRLIIALSFLVCMGVSLYLFIAKSIIPNRGDFQTWDYVFLALVLVSTILAIAFFVFFLYRKKDKKISWLKTRLEQWNNLSVHINKAGDEVFSELPIGILIYDETYVIKWVNRYSKKIFSDDLIERSINDFSPALLEGLKGDESIFTISIANAFYEIIHKADSKLVYLFDVTKRERITRDYLDRTPTLGLITLDNLEMETKTFDLQETARIRGEYLGEISEWISKYKGYLKSYDDDSLMIILDRASLEIMIQDKFYVLDKVREISRSNGIRVTLSIGIASWDVSFNELGVYAQNAIDLAEKRGGDQAVVNVQGEKIRYFGAQSNALEKNNLLAARANTLALKDAVESSSNVYIMGHIKADADALGAMIGTFRMVSTSHKPTKMVIDYDRIDVTCQKLYNEIKENDAEIFNFFVSPNSGLDINQDSLLIMVDTQSPKIAMDEEFMHKFKRLAVIDHHRSGGDSFNDVVFSYIEPYASSTVELVSEMLMFYQRERIQISAFEATIMLAGIVVDTNNFTFRCGTRTFEAASNLREYGADMIDIRRLLRNDLKLQLSLAKYVQHAEIVLDHFAISCINDEVINDRTMLAKISEHLLNIEDIEASFTIANYEDGDFKAVAVSARSYKNINVQLIMEEMGGGGHLNSAATQITDTTVAAVREQLITILKREFEIGDESMKIILLEDIKGRGVKNQVIEVAAGYGNYLITNKKGILATEENLNNLKEQLHQEALEAENQKKLMQKIKEEIEEKCVNIYIKIGADGKLFGHVTTKQICEEFEAQTGIHLDKRKVSLPVEINSLGVYTANVDLHKDVQASLEINVLEK